MKRILFFSSAALLMLITSCAQRIPEDFQTKTYLERMAYFSENPLPKGGIVFLGNSITQGGEWETYFPDKNVENRGISGDNTEGILARMQEIVAARPEKLFIMAGVNDISQKRSNQEILKNYREIIETVQRESPQTHIYVQSVLPINNDFKRYSRLIGKEDQVLSLNRGLRKLSRDKNCTYIHLFPFFTDKDQKLKKELTGDGLHLLPEAYWLWTNLIRRYVE